MIPVEMEAMDFSGIDRTWGFLHDTLNKCAQSNSHLKKCLKPVIKCLKCKTLISDGNIGLSMFVDPDRRNQNIVDLIESKLKSALELHQSSTNCNEDLYAVFGEDQKMLIVHAWSMKVEDLNENIFIGGKMFKCIALGNSSMDCFFRINQDWYLAAADKNVKIGEKSLENVSIAVFEILGLSQSNPSSIKYDTNELIKLRNRGRKEDRHKNKGEDRHLNTEKRKEDRHLNTEKRKEHNSKDRHLNTEARKENNKKRKQTLKVKNMLEDTGMETICSSCVEWNSRSSCVPNIKLPIEKITKYITENELTKNKDGRFYVCQTCKSSIDKDKEPSRNQKEILALLSFPKQIFEELEQICIPRNEREKSDPDKKYLQLNRLEDFLLKPVIPFIRIGNMPRGRYLKLKGDLIMISANVVNSLQTILPVQQKFIPVSLKRKLEYSGYYIEEIIDREKVKHFFQWFRRHNHIFKNMELKEHLIEEFEESIQSEIIALDHEKDCLVPNHGEMVNIVDIEEEEDQSNTEKITEISNKLKEEKLKSSHSTMITDKYVQDVKANTVANKLSDMILELEAMTGNINSASPNEDIDVYIEDEIYESDDEEDITKDEIEPDKLTDEDYQKYCEIKNVENDSVNFVQELTTLIDTLCKCDVERKASAIMEFKYCLEKISSDNLALVRLKEKLIIKFDQLIASSRSVLRKLPANCHHTHHENKDHQTCIESFDVETEKVMNHVNRCRKTIEKNLADKIINVAPGEKGEWINWKDDVFIEEKMFPNLFPYGIGGYISSNILKQNDSGFSNYIKSRILSADPKFRNDSSYLFFLLLVKELTDMKRSEATVFRKANKAANLTASAISEIGVKNLMRYDTAFTAFRSIRGTAPYYMDTKKKLMATIRQKGAPTLFTTFSCAEFDWIQLIKSIYETVNKKTISDDEIKKLTVAEKNKLVNENVTQSTLHFAKRTNALFSILKDGNIFVHEGRDYKVDSYFYRVEFQARGAPHIHCLLWLQSSSGEKPPNIWENGDKEATSNEENIGRFCDSMISGSASDIFCNDHMKNEPKCSECKHLKSLVEKYQTHAHKFSCQKKKKYLRIKSKEGFGRFDGKEEGEEILVPICRLGHPKFPIDKTEFIHAFPSDVDEKFKTSAKKDYYRIKKYLLRLTNDDDFKESKKWKQFIQYSFREFLHEVGMFREGVDINDDEEMEYARERYLTALKCDVKSTGLVLLKRNTEDIFTNNYNSFLIKIFQANMDIQYICDEYAVAEYICNYLTKNETAMSSLLRNINDEATRGGEHLSKTIKKIGKTLDKGRELSIQEAIYRALGLPMTKFSDVVRFISTTHPDRREGLLRSDMDTLDEEEAIFHKSKHDYYSLRPLDSEDDDYWDNMCLADFVSNYNIAYRKAKNVIKLQDDKSMIQERNRPCVIRYFLRYDNEEEYFRALCILFLPFRNESKEIHMKDTKSLYLDNKEIIEENRMKYERNQTIIDAIRKVEDKNENALDENEEEEEETFVDEETTTSDEIEDFEKSIKSNAKRVLSKFSAELMPEDEYNEYISKLNDQQRAIFQDFLQRLTFHQDESFYLYIGGNAGTGKSFLLKAMINAVNRRKRHSGAELNKPTCLTIAPTGVAAYLINGTTIESALGMQPSNDYSYTRNDPSKNSNLRFLYEDLQVIFIDEISMCSSNKLAKINLRLQDIMGNNQFMGGVSIVVTGDFGQLPPVNGQMIWRQSNVDNRPEFAPNIWNENFKICYLEEKMRSQDNEFSDVCDQIRMGQCTKEIEQYLIKHKRKCPSENDNSMYTSGRFCIIVPNNKAREKINSEKLATLLPNGKSFVADAKDKSSGNPNAPKVSKDLPLSKTGQLPSRVILKEGAPVMITSNHQIKKYKDNGLVS